MTTGGRTPLLLRLATRFLPEDARQEVLGDLLEYWNGQVSTRSWAARHWWLARQPVAVLRSRLRFGAADPDLVPTRARPASRVGFSLLDVKLGLRMVVKHPGVTLVVVFALGIGIPASLAPNHLIDAVIDESPPFEDGDRVVGLVALNQESGSEQPLRLGDYELLLEELESFESLGAALLQEVNVISDDGRAEGARGAAMSASSFALARVPPVLGRALGESDEVRGAPDVVVIGYDYWQSRLGARPDVIGSTLRIGGVPTTVVGVMPVGFEMPNQEQLWLPLRLRAVDYLDGVGPPLWVYGRLAEGVSVAEARAELAVLRGRRGTEEERALIRPDVVAFSALSVGTPRGVVATLLLIGQGVPFVLLLIACGNVAILLLARAANRSGEIALRTALGASRSRIVGQLFVEALFLALLATGVGLLAVHLLLRRISPRLDLPFWVELGVTPELVLKALTLSVLSAVLAGVLPALRATGPALQRTLQRAGAGAGGFRFGRITSALIVVEVGLGVGALFAGGMTYRMFRAIDRDRTVEIETGRILLASIDLPRSTLPGELGVDARVAHAARVAETQEALARRLASEPGVRRWSFSDARPGDGTAERRARVEGDGFPADFAGLPVVVSHVEPGFFGTLGVEALSGRTLEPGDVALGVSEPPTRVLVNTKFLERRELGLDAVGLTIRISDPGETPSGPWMEIVGVVPDLEASLGQAVFDGTPMAYLPARPGAVHPLTLVMDLGDDPTAFASTLRTILSDVDVTAILSDVVVLSDVPNTPALVQRTASGVLVGLSLIAIILSTAALYALMAFTVAQRTREIGVRIALGGRPGRIMATVARRALVQLGLGVTLGAGFWAAVFLGLGSRGSFQGELGVAVAPWPFVLIVTALLVIATGLLASLAPTLKGLRIRPVEALRVDV